MLKKLLCILVVLLFSNSAFAEAKSYVLRANKGMLYVTILKDPKATAARLSHNHVVKAISWSGTAVWDPDNPSTCSISVTVPVGNLQVDTPEMRKKVGFQRDITHSQRKSIRKNMLSKKQLWASRFPRIDFQSKSCQKSNGGFTLKGVFGLHGVKKTISVPIKVQMGKELHLTGKFKIKATDFGFKPFSGLLGQMRNQNEMTIYFDLYGTAK